LKSSKTAAAHFVTKVLLIK